MKNSFTVADAISMNDRAAAAIAACFRSNLSAGKDGSSGYNATFPNFVESIKKVNATRISKGSKNAPKTHDGGPTVVNDSRIAVDYECNNPVANQLYGRIAPMLLRIQKGIVNLTNAISNAACA
jgi:hypothetical protein